MADLFHRDQPRQRIETETAHVVSVKTPDPLGLWKEMLRNWKTYEQAVFERHHRPAKFRLKIGGRDFRHIPDMADNEHGRWREPESFAIGIQGDAPEPRLMLIFHSRSVSSPTVSLRTTMFSAWHEETYSHWDDHNEWMEDAEILLAAVGIFPRYGGPDADRVKHYDTFL